MEISKKFTFEAAHRLHHLECHPCSNLHGHSYNVTITLIPVSGRNIFDDTGMIIDFRSLDVIKKYLDDNFDHAVLVAHEDKQLIDACKMLGTKTIELPIVATTCECLTTYFYGVFSTLLEDDNCRILSVSVSETPKTNATYSAGILLS